MGKIISDTESPNSISYLTPAAAKEISKNATYYLEGFQLNNLPLGFTLSKISENNNDKIVLDYNSFSYHENPAYTPLTARRPAPLDQNLHWDGNLEQFNIHESSADVKKSREVTRDSKAVDDFDGIRRATGKISAEKTNFSIIELSEWMLRYDTRKGRAIIANHAWCGFILNTEDTDESAPNNSSACFTKPEEITALADVLYHEGLKGLEELLNALKLLHQRNEESYLSFKQIFLSRFYTYRTLSYKENADIIINLANLTPNQQNWWDTLTRAHVRTSGHADLNNLFKGYKYFLQKMQSLGFEDLPEECPITETGNMLVSMDRLLYMLKKVDIANRVDQLASFHGIDFSKEGAWLAASATDSHYRYFHPAMQLTKDGPDCNNSYRVDSNHSQAYDSKDEKDEKDEKDKTLVYENEKIKFYRTLGCARNIHTPFEDYIGLINTLDETAFAENIKVAILPIIISTTTTTRHMARLNSQLFIEALDNYIGINGSETPKINTLLEFISNCRVKPTLNELSALLSLYTELPHEEQFTETEWIAIERWQKAGSNILNNEFIDCYKELKEFDETNIGILSLVLASIKPEGANLNRDVIQKFKELKRSSTALYVQVLNYLACTDIKSPLPSDTDIISLIDEILDPINNKSLNSLIATHLPQCTFESSHQQVKMKMPTCQHERDINQQIFNELREFEQNIVLEEKTESIKLDKLYQPYIHVISNQDIEDKSKDTLRGLMRQGLEARYLSKIRNLKENPLFANLTSHLPAEPSLANVDDITTLNTRLEKYQQQLRPFLQKLTEMEEEKGWQGVFNLDFLGSSTPPALEIFTLDQLSSIFTSIKELNLNNPPQELFEAIFTSHSADINHNDTTTITDGITTLLRENLSVQQKIKLLSLIYSGINDNQISQLAICLNKINDKAKDHAIETFCTYFDGTDTEDKLKKITNLIQYSSPNNLDQKIFSSIKNDKELFEKLLDFATNNGPRIAAPDEKEELPTKSDGAQKETKDQEYKEHTGYERTTPSITKILTIISYAGITDFLSEQPITTPVRPTTQSSWIPSFVAKILGKQRAEIKTTTTQTVLQKLTLLSPSDLNDLYSLFEDKPYPSFKRVKDFLNTADKAKFLTDFELDPPGLRSTDSEINKHFSLDIAAERINELVDLNRDDNATLFKSDRQKLMTDLCFITAVGRDKNLLSINNSLANKPAMQLTKNELQELTLKYREIIKNNEPDSKESQLAMLQFVAIAREALYRTNAAFAYTTQVTSILESLIHNGNHISQINTGQGKGLTTAILAAAKWMQGGAVDVCSANMQLAARDQEEFADFFSYLGIQTSLIKAESPHETYQQDGINYSQLSDIALFQTKMELEGKEMPEKATLLLDEIDYNALDNTVQFRYATSLPGFVTHDGRNPDEWIYPVILKFLEDKDVQHNGRGKEQDIADLRHYIKSDSDLWRHLLPIAQQSEDCVKGLQKRFDTNRNHYSDELLDRWIDAAFNALQLQEGESYFTVTETREIQSQRVKVRYCRPKIGDEPGMKSTLSNGVQQFLHARLNMTASPDQPKFIIEPEKTYILSKSVKNVLDYYCRPIKGYKRAAFTDQQLEGKRIQKFVTAKLKGKRPSLSDESEIDIQQLKIEAYLQEQAEGFYFYKDKVYVKHTTLGNDENGASFENSVLETFKDPDPNQPPAEKNLQSIIDKCKIRPSLGRKKRGQVLGLTGTVGTIEERKHLRKNYEFSFTKNPPHQKNARRDDIPRIAHRKKSFLQKYLSRFFSPSAANTTHFAELLKSAKKAQANGQPIQIICDSVQTVEELFKYFDDHLSDEEKTNLTKYTARPSENSVNDILKVAGENRAITISTEAMARGTDIKPKSDKGLHVIIANILSARGEEQALGRSGRKGANGSTERIYSEEEFTSRGLKVPTARKVSKSLSEIEQSVRDIQSRMTDKLLTELNERETLSDLKQQFTAQYLEYSQYLIKKYESLSVPGAPIDFSDTLVNFNKILDEEWNRFILLVNNTNQDDTNNANINLQRFQPRNRFATALSKFAKNVSKTARRIFRKRSATSKTAEQSHSTIDDHYAEFSKTVNSKARQLLSGMHTKCVNAIKQQLANGSSDRSSNQPVIQEYGMRHIDPRKCLTPIDGRDYRSEHVSDLSSKPISKFSFGPARAYHEYSTEMTSASNDLVNNSPNEHKRKHEDEVKHDTTNNDPLEHFSKSSSSSSISSSTKPGTQPVENTQPSPISQPTAKNDNAATLDEKAQPDTHAAAYKEWLTALAKSSNCNGTQEYPTNNLAKALLDLWLKQNREYFVKINANKYSLEQTRNLRQNRQIVLYKIKHLFSIVKQYDRSNLENIMRTYATHIDSPISSPQYRHDMTKFLYLIFQNDITLFTTTLTSSARAKTTPWERALNFARYKIAQYKGNLFNQFTIAKDRHNQIKAINTKLGQLDISPDDGNKKIIALVKLLDEQSKIAIEHDTKHLQRNKKRGGSEFQQMINEICTRAYIYLDLTRNDGALKSKFESLAELLTAINTEIPALNLNSTDIDALKVKSIGERRDPLLLILNSLKDKRKGVMHNKAHLYRLNRLIDRCQLLLLQCEPILASNESNVVNSLELEKTLRTLSQQNFIAGDNVYVRKVEYTDQCGKPKEDGHKTVSNAIHTIKQHVNALHPRKQFTIKSTSYNSMNRTLTVKATLDNELYTIMIYDLTRNSRTVRAESFLLPAETSTISHDHSRQPLFNNRNRFFHTECEQENIDQKQSYKVHGM